MSLASAETLVEQRVAQLEVISNRRNELLRQMYHMTRRRNDVGPVLILEGDDQNLQGFLQRFDIVKNPDTGSITHLDEDDISLESQSQSIGPPAPTPPSLDKSELPCTTRSQSHVSNHTKSPSPSSFKPLLNSVSTAIDEPVYSPSRDAYSASGQTMDVDVGPDELGSPLSEDEKQEGDMEHHRGTIEALESQSLGETEGVREDVKSPEAKSDEDAMKVDVLLGDDEAITSQSKEATPGEASDAGISSQDVAENSEAALEDSDMHMEDLDVVPDANSEREVNQTVDKSTPLSSQSVTSPPSNEPVKSSIPFTHLGPSSPIQTIPTPRPPVIILAPSTSTETLSFTFDESPFAGPEQPKTPVSPIIHRHQCNPDYTLPSLKKLPQEFNRKAKTRSKKKDKDKDKDKESGKEKESTRKEEWASMGTNKWAAILNANPVWKRVSRPTKCLNSREWAVAMTELKLIRTFDRIESLKDGGRWSFRQPKKQRGVGGLVKTHWDYLMDEMKWMRIDFREERRWKIALAYNLATSVIEWHAAGSFEERVKRGICVLWNPAYLKSEELQNAQQDDEPMQTETSALQGNQPSGEKANTLLGVDYGSDEEEDEDQQDVVDTLQPLSLLEDALETPLQDEARGDQETLIKPKTEENEDTSALRCDESAQIDTQPGSQSVDQQMADPEERETKDSLVGLKSSSKDPILAAKTSSNSSSSNGDSDTPTTSTRSSLKQAYAPLRERIMESEIDKLFLNLDDFHITQPSKAKDDEHRDPIVIDLPPADLSTIFPELHPLSLLDVAPPPAPVPEGKKKTEKRSDRDDPNKRIEDTTYTKLFPIGQFMNSKPTLIGPLQPSKNWKDGQWLSLDETPVYVEYEGPTRPPEDMMNEIFDNRLSNSAILAQQQLMLAAAREREKDRRRVVEHQWSVNDDALLKTLIDSYPYNWQLISESFNAMRTTTPTDKRTARDCFERWREKWAPEVRRHPELPPQPSAPPAQEENITASTSPMTTRGVKRLASSMAANPVSNSSGGSEPKKRRRHILLQETIRRSAKKKAEFQQKMLSTQRKPSTVHETHAPFNNMHHFSPAELGRMKADKDAKTTHDIQLRKRQEEVTRAAQMQGRLTSAQHVLQLQQQLLQQQQQSTQQQAQQPQQTGTPNQAQAQTQTQPQQNNQQAPQPAQAQTQAVPVAQPVAQQGLQATQVANIAQRSQNTLLTNQALGNFRGQVNISRINSPNITPGTTRLTAQQILQLQQQVRPGSQPTQAGQVTGHQLGQQGQILVPSLNGNSSTLNGAHLTASFVNRDSTSSPAAHVSPPRKSATPTNVNSPRIAADQAQHGQVQMGVPNAQVAGGVLARPPTNLSYYSAIPGLTQEQLNVLRFMHQHQQQQQQQQQQQNAQQDGQG